MKKAEAISWTLVIAWAVVIFAMSAQSGDDLESGTGLLSQVIDLLEKWQLRLLGPDADILNSMAHFCEYTVFGGLLTNALHHHFPKRKALLAAIALASLYGITDEIHQIFVPGRMCDSTDWLVDTAGASLGTWIASYASRFHLQG